jgi:hypothetical protein
MTRSMLDVRQMAALLVYLEYNPDDVVETLVKTYQLKRTAAIDLVHDFLQLRAAGIAEDEEARRAALAAISADDPLMESTKPIRDVKAGEMTPGGVIFLADPAEQPDGSWAALVMLPNGHRELIDFPAADADCEVQLADDDD